MGGIEVYAVPLYFRVRPKSPVATQRPFVGAPNAVAGMVNINRESKPTTAEANKLARDIESLFRECDTVVQMGLDKANMKNTVWGVTIGYLHGLAICVCNADGSVSEEEASLYYEIFAYLFQKGDTRVGDLQGVCTIIRDGYPKCRQAFGPALHVVWLEQNDRLNGTAYASRYRELVLRMANMLAAAEGVRSEKKLSFVGEIEKALSPATMTEMANMLAAAEGVRSEKKVLPHFW